MDTESSNLFSFIMINIFIRLIKMSQNLCEKKIEKQRLSSENIILSTDLAKKRENYMLKKGRLEHQRNLFEKQYKEIQHGISPSNNIHNGINNNLEMEKTKDYRKEKSRTEELINEMSVKIILKEKEIKEKTERYNGYKLKIQEKIDQNKKLLEDLNCELNYMKNIFNQVVKDQKYYYLQILKKGIDTR